MYRQIAEELLSFIDKNPTAYHTTASVRSQLLDAGFEELMESQAWDLEPGRDYFVTRNGSSIIALRIGSELDHYGFNIIASHTDSPAFRIKEKPELKGEKYIRLNAEGYGGMILSSWLDRPLSIAGRILVRNPDGTIVSRLVNFDRDLVVIPNAAIHMNRELNDGFKYNKQVDLMPLFAGQEKGTLYGLISKEFGLSEEDILAGDLFLYSREMPTIWGCNEEFISSGRLDDQQCVFSSLKGFLDAKNPHNVSVLACFDNEEVGSGTKQGAGSTFLTDVLQRMNDALQKTQEEYLRAVCASFMISADNAHAVHPNHPEFTDAENCVYMNEGVVVKQHAGQNYTSDGMSIAILKEIAARAEVPLQFFANRSDKPSGGTLGHISAAHLSLKSVDVGIAQLAMHSCYETAGIQDTYHMVQLMSAFYASSLEEPAPGIIRIAE